MSTFCWSSPLMCRAWRRIQKIIQVRTATANRLPIPSIASAVRSDVSESAPTVMFRMTPAAMLTAIAMPTPVQTER
jgi:hypothetical protein